MKLIICIVCCFLLIPSLSFSQISKPLPGYDKEDTIRALEKLYKRKRGGGIARASVFGVIGVAALAGTIAYKPSTVQYNSQSFQVSSDGPPAINYVVIGFSTIMTITGFTQANKYKQQKLDLLLDDYDAGKPLPADLIRKFRKKDFR